MKDTDIINLGEHKGKSMANVPDSWLEWFWGENVKEYIKPNGGALSGTQYDVMEYIENYLW